MSRRERWGWKVVGLIDTSREPDREPAARLDGFPILGGVHDVARVAVDHGATRVIVVSPIRLRELVESLVLANEPGVRVDVVPELYEIFIGTVDAVVGDVPLMQITHSTVPPYYAALKRVMDVAGALVRPGPDESDPAARGVCAIAVERRLPGGLLAGARRAAHEAVSHATSCAPWCRDAEAESGPVLAEEDDGRITRVGRFLRRFRIDELPQLVNILKGEMSFVGPRPERPYFVEQLHGDAGLPRALHTSGRG